MSTDGFEVSGRKLRSRLLRWYDSRRRDLPWRRPTSPYGVWVSEIMLQQTTVAAVVPYWKRFMERFPDAQALACGSADDVLRVWSGLGYYRRARNMHRAARIICAERDGELPRTSAELERLPGIGRYTAAAIAAIAFGEPAPAVDGNVRRVLARVGAIGGNVERQPARGAIERFASRIVDGTRPGDVNQALMELGATVCRPRRPDCAACPLAASCVALRDGTVANLPELAPRRRQVTVIRAAALITGRDRLLLRRVPDGEPNAGMLEFPAVDLHHGAADRGSPPRAETQRWRERFERAFADRHGRQVTASRVVARVSHAITHHKIQLYLLEVDHRGWRPRRAPWVWADGRRAEELALTAATRKLLRRIDA